MINADVVVENKLWKKKIKNPGNYIKKKIKKIFKFNSLKKRRFSLTILLTGNSKMKYLNKKFRNKNKTTDVLSFPNLGIVDLKKKYDLKEIIKGESIFCATGITTGDIVNGIKILNNKYVTETLVTHKNSIIEVIKKEVAIT